MNAVPGTARRRTAGLGALAVAAVLLTSCAAGQVAQTANQRPSIAGVNAQVGTIAVRDLSIEAPDQGTYYPAGSALRLDGVFVNNGTSPDQLVGISSSAISGWGAYSSITDGDEVVAAATASPSAAAVSTSPAVSLSVSSASSAPASRASSSGASASRTSSASAGSPGASAGTASAPRASQSVTIPTGSRTSYGVPDATGSLLVLGTTTRIYPGSTVNLTLTFAKAGTVTVPVPVQITTDPTQASIPAPSSDSEGN